MAKKKKPKLSDADKRYCQEYVIDFDRVRAYMESHPKCKSKASARANATRLMLTNANISPYIHKLLEKQAGRAERSADDIVREMERIGFSDIRNVLKFDSSGVTLRNSQDLRPDVTAAISGISSRDTKEGTSIKLTLHNKVSALENLGKRHNLFPNTTELTGGVTFAQALAKAMKK